MYYISYKDTAFFIQIVFGFKNLTELAKKQIKQTSGSVILEKLCWTE